MSNRYVATARMTCDAPLTDEVQEEFKTHPALGNFKQIEDDGAGHPRYTCGVQFPMPEDLARDAACADLLSTNEQDQLMMEMRMTAQGIIEPHLRRIAATLGVNLIEVEITNPIPDSEDEPDPWEEPAGPGSA